MRKINKGGPETFQRQRAEGLKHCTVGWIIRREIYLM